MYCHNQSSTFFQKEDEFILILQLYTFKSGKSPSGSAVWGYEGGKRDRSKSKNSDTSVLMHKSKWTYFNPSQKHNK